MARKLLLLTLHLFGPSICLAREYTYGKWDYGSGPNGPANWGRITGASKCLGANQSPIDINTAETVEKNFSPLLLRNYDNDGWSGNARPVEMTNTGKTVKITFEGHYLVTGGGLPGIYKLAHMQFHWGSHWIQGSEHKVDGQFFPAEFQLVHYDAVRYPSLFDAMTQPDGLAILDFSSMLVTMVTVLVNTTQLGMPLNYLSKVRYVGNTFDYTQQPFRLDSLLPMKHLDTFYRYRGSLTAPGCYESVIWTVFHHPIEISEEQLAVFRTMTKLAPSRSGVGAHRKEDLILDNCRPVQELNWPQRKVDQSFNHQGLVSTGGMGIGQNGQDYYGTIGGTGTVQNGQGGQPSVNQNGGQDAFADYYAQDTVGAGFNNYAGGGGGDYQNVGTNYEIGGGNNNGAGYDFYADPLPFYPPAAPETNENGQENNAGTAIHRWTLDQIILVVGIFCLIQADSIV
ncbi:LOW QUALITY PROTEIN: carbonic anhydrase 1-like [Amphiura filiformis]|uniref:LOW QUALITY PROTEIN: carbonic anhydrase 1-like n=1 Tax=Amphiura filiformis TaxID=82378 RepID=UPI003B226E65